MKLINFRATRIHGYLNFNFKFKEDITFLIGINGTGKTSVLKIILGLISPSYTNLNQIEFEEVDLIIGNSIDSPTLNIQAFRKASYLIEIRLINYLTKEIISAGTLTKVDLEIETSSEERNEYIKAARTEFESQPIYSALKKITTPLFLGLDRRIYEGHQIDSLSRKLYLQRKRYSNVPSSDPLNRSLMDLQESIFDYYRVIGAKQNSYNEEFKNNILAQSFEFVEEFGFNLQTDYRDLLKMKEETIEAIKTLNVSSLNTKISIYFEKMVEVLKEVQKGQDTKTFKATNEKSLELIKKWFNNQPQLKRIQDIIGYSLSFKKQVDVLYEPVIRLKNLIDEFFNESNKSLVITPEGEFRIALHNNSEKTDASCYQLSSGEKQILTMIGHLIFFKEISQDDPGIFIIDEPELSLHLAWQELFVNAIQNASPNTQFILATHSPTIISAYDESYCEDLAEQNK